MRICYGAMLLSLVLGDSVNVSAGQVPPVPERPPWAQTTLGFNPKTRCPDLRMADEGTMAVVVFWLLRSGTASQPSVKSSSGSTALDSAALACVARLRFAPATTIGTGDAVDSWQQVAFRWADRGPADETRTSAVSAPAGPGSQDDPHGQANSVTVRVCADETGKLRQDPTIVHSSGVASLDQAAMKIAASGSAYYRPQTASNGPAVSGCAQLAIKFDAK
jgi:TonB family protein